MRTVVIGASDNPDRYSYLAVNRLISYGHEVFAVGMKNGYIGHIPLTKEKEAIMKVDTVTLYVGKQNQPYWYEYILSLKPRRIIFNPGTENSELEQLAAKAGIQTVHACTLVMLSVGSY
jgi:uncharacterized protein